MANFIILCIASVLLSAVTSDSTTTTPKPSTTTTSLTPDHVKHIADYCLEADGSPSLDLSTTETLESTRLISAWGSGDQWNFYANPCALTINVPDDHGVVMGVEYWSYREDEQNDVNITSASQSSQSCNKKLKVEYTGTSGSAIKESTEICINQMQQSQAGIQQQEGKWRMRNYQLLSSYDHKMKVIFYDNDNDDGNDNDYYITLTAARRDCHCRPDEFQCIEHETSGVPHCVHRDLLCDGHVNCATVTEPFDEIFKNCYMNDSTKAIFHGVDISVQPWYTGIALRYFLVLCLIVSVFFMFIACYFCPKYAAHRRNMRQMRQSRVSIVPLPTTTSDAKAVEAQQTQQNELPPYEATVQTPPDYKSLFLPLQVNTPARSNNESQS